MNNSGHYLSCYKNVAKILSCSQTSSREAHLAREPWVADPSIVVPRLKQLGVIIIICVN